MESVRIYVPEARVGEPTIRQALDGVVQEGATLYHATGTWNNGDGLVVEGLIVVEVLDCDDGRRESIDQLVVALLAAGEEAVLIARQNTTTHLSVRSEGVPAAVGAQASPLAMASGKQDS